ncbi:MAG: galactose-1-phosphate uridylyltransferase, partial [Oscillospiraceae bacterium]|nr:galactose-1-phosphate uridylyltransferase [Oscillospiraceae bacterium]
MIFKAINDLANYAVKNGLIEECDRVWAINRLMSALKIDEWCEPESANDRPLEDILAELLDEAVRKGIIEDDITSRDLFDTELMGILTPRPSQVRAEFEERYADSPEAATDWYYSLSQNTDYIRRYRIAKDMKWVSETKYGDLDITINLSKPEKDPKAIAAAKNAPQSGYPKCMLCRENEGYSGRMNHPARQNHRIIPLVIDQKDWFFQY